MTNKEELVNVSCTVCGSSPCMVVLRMPKVPVHCNVLCPQREEALDAPMASISLTFCEVCGHLFNSTFDPQLMNYGPKYENSLHWSPRFQRYAMTLASSLTKRYALRAKTIVEIGCGDGKFLQMLCQHGENRGLGFDPACPRSPNGNSAKESVVVVPDSYSAKYASDADFVCCRHTLEHIENPRGFLTLLREAIGERAKTPVFFEVPNALLMLRELGIWDIIFEHCSYFSRSSLVHLFSSSGFTVLGVREGFAKQFLRIEARPAGSKTAGDQRSGHRHSPMAGDIARFRRKYGKKIEFWRGRLGKSLAGRRLVVWGAGSKGVSFLNALNVRDQIQYVVDINPRKHGMYVPGSGQQIVPPEFLKEYRPDAVIVMNSIYRNEIRSWTTALGVDATCISV
jgi:C-methyltransferase C-terminal domain/Methyltransferase domain